MRPEARLNSAPRYRRRLVNAAAAARPFGAPRWPQRVAAADDAATERPLCAHYFVHRARGAARTHAAPRGSAADGAALAAVAPASRGSPRPRLYGRAPQLCRPRETSTCPAGRPTVQRLTERRRQRRQNQISEQYCCAPNFFSPLRLRASRRAGDSVQNGAHCVSTRPKTPSAAADELSWPMLHNAVGACEDAASWQTETLFGAREHKRA